MDSQNEKITEFEELCVKEKLFKWFGFNHLSEEEFATGEQFFYMAKWIVNNIPANAERTVALRSLIKARDEMLRAVLEGEQLRRF